MTKDESYELQLKIAKEQAGKQTQIESLKQKLQAAEKQTAELQQEVERLKSERDGERLQVERLMIENGVIFKALKRCREGYANLIDYEILKGDYMEEADSLIDLIDEALNPQQDENGI